MPVQIQAGRGGPCPWPIQVSQDKGLDVGHLVSLVAGHYGLYQPSFLHYLIRILEEHPPLDIIWCYVLYLTYLVWSVEYVDKAERIFVQVA
jgi:hypothetical protein